MLSVQELVRIAASMKRGDFEKQLGPYVLVQRPPDAQTQQRALQLGAQRTMAHKAATDTVSLLFELDTLEVATLPVHDDSVPLTVGRLPDCDLVIDDPSVSKHHARLTWRADAQQALVEDLGSSNGTLVNGIVLTGPRAVNDGDDVSFGDARYCFLLSSTLHTRLTSGRFKAR